MTHTSAGALWEIQGSPSAAGTRGWGALRAGLGVKTRPGFWGRGIRDRTSSRAWPQRAHLSGHTGNPSAHARGHWVKQGANARSLPPQCTDAVTDPGGQRWRWQQQRESVCVCRHCSRIQPARPLKHAGTVPPSLTTALPSTRSPAPPSLRSAGTRWRRDALLCLPLCNRPFTHTPPPESVSFT